ncbi:MAG: hypothetical protein ACXWZE_21910, partial [Candidatus Binatia bacterium]
EGGFQTRPYDSRYFLRFLRSLRPFFFSVTAVPRRAFVVKVPILFLTGQRFTLTASIRRGYEEED